MILLLDNYDSFVFNLARYLRELGEEVRVVRNDASSVEALARLRPSHLVVSPGPCTPAEAGVANELILRLGDETPVLGVCLGHQCIGAAFGAQIVRAARPMHGKVSPIHHDGRGVFTGLPSPFRGTRYHSLVVRRESLPDHLEVTAWTEKGEVMGLQDRERPIWGLQFHPEAILTEHGHALLANFLALGRGEPPPGASTRPPVRELERPVPRGAGAGSAPTGSAR